ncbi:MAG: ABC transporter ATP-binding protein [Solirubrobacterales bacterium]
MAEVVLAASGLARTFPPAGGGDEVRALGVLDIELRRGELVSVIGPSGCGKSTLLNLLAGLDEPTHGSVALASGDPLLGSVAYMPQADLLMPWRTVLDNAAVGPQLRGTPIAIARERARAELGRFGLEGFADAWPSQISGGMRQRTALLRTFLTDCDVMLLDEPFGALDALTRQDMQERLVELWSEEGRTILFVTHDVEEALFLGDRVIRMTPRPGRIADEVTVDLPRPRVAGETDLQPRFIELKRALEAPLRARDEVRPS